MKNKQQIIVQLLGAVLFGTSTLTAQVYKMAENGAYYPGGVSNTGVASMNLGGTIYKWDQVNGLVNIGAITNSRPFGGRVTVSNDGTLISSTKTNPSNELNEISLYNIGSQTWQYLGGLELVGQDGGLSTSWGFSADGTTIVGLSNKNNVATAVKWDAEDGMQALPSTIPNRSSRANAISNDKNTIVGWQDQLNGDRNGVKWTNGVQEFLKDTAGNFVGEASGVSADGGTIVGVTGLYPYVWNSATGYEQITHPNSGPFFRGAASAISADGKTVVGYFRAFPGSPYGGEGFIWTPTGGRQNLNTYVTSLGLDTQGVTFGLPLAISSDGKKIVGTGVKTGTNTAVAFLIDITAATLSTGNIQVSSVAIAPNPVKNVLNILGQKIETAEIYNLTGQKLKTIKIVDNKADVSFLTKGIYILQVTADGQKQSLKMIKE